MRAAAITRYGHPPEVIDMASPEASAGFVLVRVEAAPINALDLLCATGNSYFGQHPLPYIPGVEGVGTVIAGDRFTRGTRVWFRTDAGMKPVNGSMAEFAASTKRMAAPLEADIRPPEAAALGLSAVAALLSLTKAGGIQPGEQVLVLGAGGSVGRLAIQLALLLGARRVVAAARTPTARKRATDLGAAAAVALVPGGRHDIEHRLRDALDGDLNLVIDTLAGDPATAALAVVAPGGRLVNLGSSAGPEVSVASTVLRSREVSIIGYTNARASFPEKAAAFGRAAAWAAAGTLRQNRETVPLNEVARAWGEHQAGTSRKLVVVPGATA